MEEDAEADSEAFPVENSTILAGPPPVEQKPPKDDSDVIPKRTPRARKAPSSAGGTASSRPTKRATAPRPIPAPIEEPIAAFISRKHRLFIGVGVAAAILAVVPIVWLVRGRSNGAAKPADN